MILLFQEGILKEPMILQEKYQQTVFAFRFYESLDSNFFTLLFVSMLPCDSMILIQL